MCINYVGLTDGRRRIPGGCDVDKGYSGPVLPTGEDGKFTITHDFVRDMIAYFKEGKSIPRRYVWEIVLGAHSYFEEEESLVNLDVEEGMTVDVIGDVHGRCPSSVINSSL